MKHTLLRLLRWFNKTMKMTLTERIYSEKKLKSKTIYNYIEVERL